MTSDDTFRYVYNAENRMVSATPLYPVTGSKKLEAAYDYQGRRVSKTVSTYNADSWERDTTKTFVYDGWNVIREQTVHGSTTTTEYYVWGLDLSGSLQGAGGIGGLLLWKKDAGTFLYLYDANGNVGQLVNAATGAIAARYEYDPFGNTLVADGTEAANNPYRFSTKYFDGETGLLYYGYRYYSPKLGRWTIRDPIGEEGGFNLYVFVINDPVNGYDIYGLSPNPTPTACPCNPSQIVLKLYSAIVKGTRATTDIHAIVLHQTSTPTEFPVFNSYQAGGPNGAHFLITKDGCIYQTAQLTEITWHTGTTKSRCRETNTCSQQEKQTVESILFQQGVSYGQRVENLSIHERAKSYPDRYPFNDDAVGIEFVGEIGQNNLYVSLTSQQQDAARFLINKLKQDLGLTDNDIYRHPEIGYKDPSEAGSVTW